LDASRDAPGDTGGVAAPPAAAQEAGWRALIALPGRGSHIAVTVVHSSRVGYLSFQLPLHELAENCPPRPIGFVEFATLVAAEPAIGNGDGGRALTFLRRVLDSVANIDDVLSRPGPAPAVFGQRDPSFIEGERALRFGHAVHPTPRSRDQFTCEDSRRYAAEYGHGFSLRWWAAAPEVVAQGASGATPATGLSAALAAGDAALAPHVKAAGGDGRVLLPMHPWQASRLALEPEIDALFRAGLLTDLGSSGAPWYATSSLRSIYAPHADWMLKVSLSLRLTNSERIIELYECERGVEIDKLLAGSLGDKLASRLPTFQVLGEPAYLALRSPEGRVLPATTVVFRDNPFKHGGPPAAMLAGLCEIYADGRGSALGDILLRLAEQEGTTAAGVARRWFGRFLQVVVAPLLIVQADYGLLFGAHQQNIVVGLADGWPSKLYFRDCQGTGYVSEFLPQLARDAPGVRLDAGHLFASAQAAQLAGYYLIANSVFAVIGTLATGGFADEPTLVSDLRKFLEELLAQPLRDKTCLDYLLHSPTLMSKGNFMICFRNINENTDVVDPLAGYVELPNPIAKA
jgi:N2-citryl-N6-acetyl-N6-hydroxylysine synthase